jgi:hypothetical protein
MARGQNNSGGTENKDKNKPAAAEQPAAGSGETAGAGTDGGHIEKAGDPGDEQPEQGKQPAAAADLTQPAQQLPAGPTIEAYVKAGYDPATYPPDGYREQPSAGLDYYRAHGVVEPVVPMTEEHDAPDTATLVPCDNGAVDPSPDQKELLLDACRRFNVDPTVERTPRELLKWRCEPANRLTRVPASVTIVTAGGVKLKHYDDPDYPMDQDTEETLARIFSAFAKDPKTKELIRLPLPEDLALPITAVTGYPQTADHQYRRGYLREGGKKEADRREKTAAGAAKKAGKK